MSGLPGSGGPSAAEPGKVAVPVDGVPAGGRQGGDAAGGEAEGASPGHGAPRIAADPGSEGSDACNQAAHARHQTEGVLEGICGVSARGWERRGEENI